MLSLVYSELLNISLRFAAVLKNNQKNAENVLIETLAAPFLELSGSESFVEREQSGIAQYKQI